MKRIYEKPTWFKDVDLLMDAFTGIAMLMGTISFISLLFLILYLDFQALSPFFQEILLEPFFNLFLELQALNVGRQAG